MICWQEPKSTRRKHAGYSNIIEDAVRLVKEVDSPHIKILFDTTVITSTIKFSKFEETTPKIER